MLALSPLAFTLPTRAFTQACLSHQEQQTLAGPLIKVLSPLKKGPHSPRFRPKPIPFHPEKQALAGLTSVFHYPPQTLSTPTPAHLRQQHLPDLPAVTLPSPGPLTLATPRSS